MLHVFIPTNEQGLAKAGPSIITDPHYPPERTDMCNVIVCAANQVWDRAQTELWFNPWKCSKRIAREDRKVIER